MKRDELKKQVNSKIKEGIKNFIFNLPTGYGKSSLALHIINKVSIKRPKVLLLVAERAHKSNWQKEIEKFLTKEADIRMECYQSLHKLGNIPFDILIADEAHHLNTSIRQDLFKAMDSKYKIFLSATYDKVFKLKLLKLPQSYEFSVDLQTAIDNNTLPIPRILVLESEMPDTDRLYSFNIRSDPNSPTIVCDYPERYTYKNKYPNNNIEVYCTFAEYISNIQGLRNYYKTLWLDSRSKIYRDKYMSNIIKEKRFLGSTKTGILQSYAEKFRKENRRFIFFTTSISQAEEIGNAITSNTTNPDGIIRDFNEGKTNELIAVNMLQEGQNLVDTEVGFISQVDASSRSLIQKVGRLLRHPSPTIIIHYYKGTIEEEYTKKILSDTFSANFIEYKELKLR